jgi:hypothetical protein
LSPEALKTHFRVVMRGFEGFVQDKHINAHIQPSAVRIHSELSEKYMDGNSQLIKILSDFNN